MQNLAHQLIDNRTLLFYLLLALTLLLTRIPLIGKYFRSLNTMIHEAGHAIMTMIVSGEVIAINLFADTSGNTITKSKNKFSQILVSLAGYPASTACGYLFFYLHSKGFDLYLLFGLVSLTLLLMVLSIRNSYGLFWAGTFSLINLLLIYYDDKSWFYIAVTFFTLIVVVDSLISTAILFALSIKNPKKAGDASNLEKFTRIPAIIWSIIFLAFSIYITYLLIINYFPPISGIFN